MFASTRTHDHTRQRPHVQSQSSVDSDASTPPDPSLCSHAAAMDGHPAKSNRTAAAPSLKSRAASSPARKARPAPAFTTHNKSRAAAASRKPRAASASRKPRAAVVAASRKPRAAAAASRKQRATSRNTRAATRASRDTRADVSASRHDGPVCVRVGDRVEVFWEGEGEWYAGEVVEVDNSDETYKVHYFVDGCDEWHGSDMDVRTLVES